MTEPKNEQVKDREELIKGLKLYHTISFGEKFWTRVHDGLVVSSGCSNLIKIRVPYDYFNEKG